MECFGLDEWRTHVKEIFWIFYGMVLLMFCEEHVYEYIGIFRNIGGWACSVFTVGNKMSNPHLPGLSLGSWVQDYDAITENHRSIS